MHYLYVDNFRGFSDSLIPIKDVNFFVGENSTGKTSILGLIDLFSDSNFLQNHNFDTDEVKFGHFSDIVSVHAEDKSYFTIGMISENDELVSLDGKKNKKIKKINAFLMTFKERDGLPYLYRYTFNINDQLTEIKRLKSKILYKRDKVSNAENSLMFHESIYKDWIKAHKKDQAGFKTLILPEYFTDLDGLPMMLISSFIDDQESVKNDSKRKDSITFQLLVGQPMLGRPLIWLAPIRTTPKRTYDEVQLDFTPEGTHTPYVIKKILDSRVESGKFIKRINKIGKSSGLFQSIATKKYGKGPTSPFELDILIDNKALNISLVGYGVSQSLPVIVELLNRANGSWFAIQQPEVHLHPKAQAALGDLFFELSSVEDKKFIIETHSDFTIDRFRINYMNKRHNKPDAQVLFFERKNKKNTAVSIQIDENGNLPAKQPKKYREFFFKEEMKLLGI